MSFVQVLTRDGRFITIHSSQLPSFGNQQVSVFHAEDSRRSAKPSAINPSEAD
jgi:hypothetical protein